MTRQSADQYAIVRLEAELLASKKEICEGNHVEFMLLNKLGYIAGLERALYLLKGGK